MPPYIRSEKVPKEKKAKKGVKKKKKDPKSVQSERGVMKIVGSQFDGLVNDKSRDVIVMLYAPWCENSKAFLPHYEAFAKSVAGIEGLLVTKMDAARNDAGVSSAFSHENGFPAVYLSPAAPEGGEVGPPFEYDIAKQRLGELLGFVNKNAAAATLTDELKAVISKENERSAAPKPKAETDGPAEPKEVDEKGRPIAAKFEGESIDALLDQLEESGYSGMERSAMEKKIMEAKLNAEKERQAAEAAEEREEDEVVAEVKEVAPKKSKKEKKSKKDKTERKTAKKEMTEKTEKKKTKQSKEEGQAAEEPELKLFTSEDVEAHRRKKMKENSGGGGAAGGGGVWAQFDEDDDGGLSLQEWGVMYRNVQENRAAKEGAEGPPPPPPTVEDIKMRFEALDVDGDGKLTQEEAKSQQKKEEDANQKVREHGYWARMAAAFPAEVVNVYEAINAEDAEALAELLASEGIQERIDLQDVGGQTPLVFASLGGQEEAVRQLLAAGADTSIGESGGYTPLHASAYQGRAGVVKLLLAHGLDGAARHTDGFAPFHRVSCSCRSASAPLHFATPRHRSFETVNDVSLMDCSGFAQNNRRV